MISAYQWAEMCGICSWKDANSRGGGGIDGSSAVAAIQNMREQTQQHYLVEELFVRDEGVKQACCLFDKHVYSVGVREWKWMLQDGSFLNKNDAQQQLAGQVFCQELDQEDSVAEFIIHYAPDETTLPAPYLYVLNVWTNQTTIVDIPCAGQEDMCRNRQPALEEGSEQFSVASPCWLSADQTMEDLPDYCRVMFEDSGCYDMERRCMEGDDEASEDHGSIESTTSEVSSTPSIELPVESTKSTKKGSSTMESEEVSSLEFSNESSSSSSAQPKLCIQGDVITWDEFVPAKTIMVEVATGRTDYCYRIVLGREGTFDQMKASSCPDDPEDYEIHYQIGTYDADASADSSMALEYTHGYYCNVIGDARSGHVQLSTSKSITEPVILVEEMGTCQYEAEIQLPFCSNVHVDSEDITMASSHDMESNDMSGKGDDVMDEDSAEGDDDEQSIISDDDARDDDDVQEDDHEPIMDKETVVDDDAMLDDDAHWTEKSISTNPMSNTKKATTYMRPLGQRSDVPKKTVEDPMRNKDVVQVQDTEVQTMHGQNDFNPVVLLALVAAAFMCAIICCTCCMCACFCANRRSINKGPTVEYSMVPQQ